MDIATKDENSYQLLPRTDGVREPDRALSFQPDLKVYNYHPLIHTFYTGGQNTTSWERAERGKCGLKYVI